LAYAHVHVGANGEITEHCATDDPGNKALNHHHSPPDKGTTPHCPYCPGFSAGATLSFVAPCPTMPGVVATTQIHVPPCAPAGRSSVRIAQQRAPPAVS